jgi:hypothetical protein
MVRATFTTAGKRFALGAVAAAVLGSIAAATLPLFTVTEETAMGTTNADGSALDAAGTGAIWLVLIPIAVATFPLLVPPEARDGVLVGCAVLLGVFAFVTASSAGLFFVPATILMVVAAVIALRHRSDPA